MEFLVGGEVVGADATAENGNSYSVSWDSTSADDGPILIEARAYDTSGQFVTSSRTAVVDNRAPMGRVLINGGARITNKSTVRLTLSAQDPDPGSSVESMRFSNNGTNWSGWEPYAASKAWTLRRGVGTRTVYAQYKDRAGNESAVVKDAIRRTR